MHKRFGKNEPRKLQGEVDRRERIESIYIYEQGEKAVNFRSDTKHLNSHYTDIINKSKLK